MFHQGPGWQRLVQRLGREDAFCTFTICIFIWKCDLRRHLANERRLGVRAEGWLLKRRSCFAGHPTPPCLQHIKTNKEELDESLVSLRVFGFL